MALRRSQSLRFFVSLGNDGRRPDGNGVLQPLMVANAAIASLYFAYQSNLYDVGSLNSGHITTILQVRSCTPCAKL
jgi:hypothetical protein